MPNARVQPQAAPERSEGEDCRLERRVRAETDARSVSITITIPGDPNKAFDAAEWIQRLLIKRAHMRDGLCFWGNDEPWAKVATSWRTHKEPHQELERFPTDLLP